MANYTPLSSDAWGKILVGAVSAEMLLDHRFCGIRYRVNYPNGYGVSIIKNMISYGGDYDLWEIAVLKDNKLCYDTHITSDVIGFLSDDKVADYCQQIRCLH